MVYNVYCHKVKKIIQEKENDVKKIILYFQ